MRIDVRYMCQIRTNQLVDRYISRFSLCLFILSVQRLAILVEKYGTYTAVNVQLRAVYAPYFYRNPGRCFTTVCNENTACIRPYMAKLRLKVRLSVLIDPGICEQEGYKILKRKKGLINQKKRNKRYFYTHTRKT